MSNEERMQQCIVQAAAIIKAYRDQAPKGCDPKNTWAFVAVGGGMLLSSGVSAYGASQQPGQQNPEPERDVRHNLNAYFRGLGSQLGLESLYRPQYGALQLRETSNMLFGTPQANFTRRIPFVNEDGTISYRQQRVNRPASPGLLSMIDRSKGDIGRMYFGDQLQQREGLLNSLAGQAQEDLDLGYGMSPGLRRELEQSTIGSASLRGFGHSPLDAYETYRALGSEAESLRRQRQGFGMNVAGLLREAKPETVTAAQLLGAGSSLSQAAGPRLVNPFQFNPPSAPANGQANSMMALGGGLLGAAGQLGGAYMAGRGTGGQPQSSYYNPTAQYGSPYPIA